MQAPNGRKVEALADFLKMEVEDIQTWSDGSFTIGNKEYELSKRERSYVDSIGKSKGYFVYYMGTI